VRKKELPEGWEWKKIEDISVKVEAINPENFPEKEYFYLDIDSIDNTRQSITNPKKILGKDAPSRARQIVKTGDILFSTVRTYLKNIAFVDKQYNDQIASTGFCIIRPGKNVDNKFIFHFVQTQEFLKNLELFQRGANYPAVRDIDILSQYIPLPPLPVQCQIVAVLEQAEALKRWRQEADALMGALLQSVFYEMFGDPVRNDGGWEITNFGKCCKSIRYGVGMPPQYRDGGIPFVRATNIKNGTIVDNNLKFVSIEDSKEIEKCRIHHGDLIVVRSGVNTGDAAFVPHKFEGALAGFDLIVEFNNPAQTLFFNFLINSQYGKSQINLYKRRAAQEHLNSEQLSSLRVPNPPLALQQQFARVVTEVERIRERQAESRREIEGLCEGLMQGAFAGELVA